MKTFIHKFANIGLSQDRNAYEVKRIQIFNYSNLVGIIVSLVRVLYIAFTTANHYTNLTILANFLPLALCIVMSVCMYYKKYKTATYLSFLCFPPVLFIMYAATMDYNVSIFLILYFIFPFFFLNRPRNIMVAFCIAVVCFLLIQLAGNFSLLFYNTGFYKADATLSYIDITFALTFIFSSLYSIKFMVWAYQKSINNKKKELKQLNQFKDKMFSIISHDLRSPIAATSQLIDLLEIVPMEQDEFRMYLAELKGQVNNARELMDNMLIWAKKQMESQTTITDHTQISEIVDDTFQSLNKQAGNKQIQLIKEIDPTHMAFTDKEMIRVVVRNILSNAIKFTNSGGQVKIKSSTNGKNILLQIEDNGVGIPADKHAMVLGNEYFTSYGTAKEKGSGLGLRICRDFVEKNNGTLSFTSEEGKGTTFYITLPVKVTECHLAQMYTANSLKVKPGFFQEAKFSVR